MLLLDVNVLVYAHREDAPDHAVYLRWLQQRLDADEPWGLSELVLSGFLRVVTHPKVFGKPSPVAAALAFAEALRSATNCVIVAPGGRHWEIFRDLVSNAGCKGNQVPDAFHAALAIESGSEWVTCDRGFGRFKGLRWRHPLEGV